MQEFSVLLFRGESSIHIFIDSKWRWGYLFLMFRLFVVYFFLIGSLFASDDVFNVRDFGAIGDGSVSDTAAIQRAIDAAAKVNGTVIFPDGNYRCAGLKTYPNIKLKGEPKWGYSVSYGANLILDDYSAECLIDITDSKNIHISGLMLNADRKPSSKTHGIMFDKKGKPRNSDTDTITIEDCKIRGFGGHGAYLRGVFVLIMRRNMINKNLGSGVECSGCDFYIIDNVFGANGKYGFGGRVSSGMFTHNRVEWNESYGLYLGKGGNYWNIVGNQFDHNHGAGVFIDGVWSVAINGNAFRRNGRNSAKLFEGENSANLLVRSKGVSVAGNTFMAGHTDGRKDYYTPRFGILFADSENCTAISNTMHHGYTEAPTKTIGKIKNCEIKDNPSSPHPQTY